MSPDYGSKDENTDMNEKLIENIQRLMQDAGISGRALARELGLSHSAPSNWLKRHQITELHVRKLAQYFGVSEEELRYGNPSPPSAADFQSVLIDVVREVEGVLSRREISLSPDKKATLIAHLVERFAREGAVDPRMVDTLVQLAA